MQHRTGRECSPLYIMNLIGHISHIRDIMYFSYMTYGLLNNGKMYLQDMSIGNFLYLVSFPRAALFF